jgi:hypothetical protein
MILNTLKLSVNSVRNSSLKRILIDKRISFCVLQKSLKKFYSNSTKSDEMDDKPVKYTTSKAHLKHKSYENFRFSDEEIAETPVYERPILLTSFAIFLIYFGILREPNDIDEKLGANLFDTVPELELPLIESAIQNYEMIGLDTTQLKNRFDELKQLKEEVEKTNNKTNNE